MKLLKKNLAISIIVLGLVACSPKQNNEKPHGVLTDAQQKTLDGAKHTEDVLKKADEDRLKKLEEAGN